MIPRHLLPKRVQDDLDGADRLRSGFWIVILFLALAAAIFLLAYYGDAIDNWRL
jgi:uncharacterized membrane protein YjjP (DUF1212 family)